MDIAADVVSDEDLGSGLFPPTSPPPPADRTARFTWLYGAVPALAFVLLVAIAIARFFFKKWRRRQLIQQLWQQHIQDISRPGGYDDTPFLDGSHLQDTRPTPTRIQ